MSWPSAIALLGLCLFFWMLCQAKGQAALAVAKGFLRNIGFHGTWDVLVLQLRMHVKEKEVFKFLNFTWVLLLLPASSYCSISGSVPTTRTEN